MKLPLITQRLKEIAPLNYAESWDNVGLLINPLQSVDIDRILLTIDLTEAVADEAIAAEAKLILSYHPILFHPVNRLNADNAYDRTVMKLIKHNIAVYSPHTALDAVNGGVNDWLAASVGEGKVSILKPLTETPDVGQGRMVTLNDPVDLETVAQRIKTYLGLNNIRIAKAAREKPIKTVALCAGAGTDTFKGVRADLLLTGEMSHHYVLAATLGGSNVILCEHSNTERGYLPSLSCLLHKAFGQKIEVVVSTEDHDPLEIS